jgi:hypothetical protein
VIPLELVTFAVEAALGLDDSKFIRITFKYQVIVVSSATKIGFAIVCRSGQGGVEQMCAKQNKCPVGEIDEELGTRKESGRYQPSDEIDGHHPAVDYV